MEEGRGEEGRGERRGEEERGEEGRREEGRGGEGNAEVGEAGRNRGERVKFPASACYSGGRNMTRAFLSILILLALAKQRTARSTTWRTVEEDDQTGSYVSWGDSRGRGRKQAEGLEGLRGGLQCGTLDMSSPLTSKVLCGA
eukprot:764083-Hanusia_phi.AAC.1